MEQLQDNIESIPGFGIIQGYFDDRASEMFNGNPYEDKNGKRLRLPPDITSKQEQKTWRSVQKMAWKDDKCFLGSCGVGLDCGVGLGPIASIFPVVGPILMFYVHLRLVRLANDRIRLPADMIAKMEGQILFDLLITLPPVIGIFTSWINSCLTRNANSIYKYMSKIAVERSKQTNIASYEGTQRPVYGNSAHTGQESGYVARNQREMAVEPQSRSQNQTVRAIYEGPLTERPNHPSLGTGMGSGNERNGQSNANLPGPTKPIDRGYYSNQGRHGGPSNVSYQGYYESLGRNYQEPGQNYQNHNNR